MHYIYLIYCEETDLYKIGRTNDYARRLQDLQRDSAVPLRLHRLMTCVSTEAAVILERELHRIFDYRRTHGEWFRLNAEEMEMFDEPHPMSLVVELTTVPLEPQEPKISSQPAFNRERQVAEVGC